jgi:hypothetical protein
VCIDEGNDEGMCDDVLGYGKIVTISVSIKSTTKASPGCS